MMARISWDTVSEWLERRQPLVRITHVEIAEAQSAIAAGCTSLYLLLSPANPAAAQQHVLGAIDRYQASLWFGLIWLVLTIGHFITSLRVPCLAVAISMWAAAFTIAFLRPVLLIATPLLGAEALGLCLVLLVRR